MPGALLDITGPIAGSLAPTVTLHDVELCQTGAHVGATGVTPVDRAQFESMIAAGLDPEVDRAPAHPGHFDPRFVQALADGEPAVGYVRPTRIVDLPDGTSKLIGDLEDVPAKLAAIIPKAYARRSIEFSPTITPSGRAYPAALTGLGLLGVAIPAVKGLADLVNRYSAPAPAWPVPMIEIADTPGLGGSLSAAWWSPGHDVPQTTTEGTAMPQLDPTRYAQLVAMEQARHAQALTGALSAATVDAPAVPPLPGIPGMPAPAAPAAPAAPTQPGYAPGFDPNAAAAAAAQQLQAQQAAQPAPAGYPQPAQASPYGIPPVGAPLPPVPAPGAPQAQLPPVPAAGAPQPPLPPVPGGQPFPGYAPSAPPAYAPGPYAPPAQQLVPTPPPAPPGFSYGYPPPAPQPFPPAPPAAYPGYPAVPALPAPPAPGAVPGMVAQLSAGQLSELQTRAARGDQAMAALEAQQREHYLSAAVDQGRISAAERTAWAAQMGQPGMLAPTLALLNSLTPGRVPTAPVGSALAAPAGGQQADAAFDSWEHAVFGTSYGAAQQPQAGYPVPGGYAPPPGYAVVPAPATAGVPAFAPIGA